LHMQIYRFFSLRDDGLKYLILLHQVRSSVIKDANAVVRFYNTSYKRISAEKYTTDVHYAITILNPNGNHAAELIVNYDRNSRVTDMKGFLYNKNGILQAKLKDREIRDYVVNNSYTLFSDQRAKQFTPAVSFYPYTIEFKYTIETAGVVGFDTWMPCKWFKVAVEEAELSFSFPKELDFKHKELNYDFTKKETISGNVKVYTWSAKNLKAIVYEPQAPNYLDFIPAVLLSPNEIVYEGTTGDFSTWESYGRWGYSLIEGRDVLPEKTIGYIAELTDSISTKREKAKAIYKYMQSKTRYVNVALGIGGFQPILARDVDEKGYGDCKALSNYTKALLKCAGIESYYAEIGTGKYQEIKFTDFASANQTNHIILCVPMESDTVWLECTNQKIPFGYIPPGSQNRYALLIKPQGGELVKTPAFNAFENTSISSIKLAIKEIGCADFEIVTEYSHSLYNEIFPLLIGSEKEQKDELYKNLFSSKNIEIEGFSVEEKSITTPNARLYVRGKICNFTSRAGSRIFFAPDFLHSNDIFNFIPDNRKLDIFEPIYYSYIDTLHISLPKGYSAESLHNSLEINSVYGKCSFDVQQTNETITIVRKLSINQGRYNCSLFGEINEFLRSISGYENKKIILNN
jgi:hypothetical protein